MNQHAIQFEFTPLAEPDFRLLFDWLNRPHITQWWDAPTSLAQVRDKYLPRLGSTSVHPYLAFLHGRPEGFIQSYVVVAEQASGWWPDERDPGAVGIDQFLADAQNLDKGIGTEMVTQFTRVLFQNPAVTKIQTDPAPTNLRAIRCYEKAAFEKVGLVETPAGRTLLMVLERARMAEKTLL